MTVSGVSNRIVADIPTNHPALGFEDYASALAEAIAAADRPQFTVGLYGKWGSGKSSLLKAINRILKSSPDVITVEFDAWRYQRSQEIVIPLLYAVLAAVQKTNDHTLARAVGRLLRAFGVSLGFKIPVVGIEFSAADVKAAWDEDSKPAVSLDDAFARPFDELRRVGEALEGRRIVVFVDDLDRCTSENVVGMLESINVITDVAGFIFVLALDYDVVTQAVQKRYAHANGHEFIEKIIQVPFRIPSVITTAPGTLEALVPGFRDLRHLADLRFELEDAIEVAFRGNPRSVKRFVNALTLLMRILEARNAQFDAQLLTRILAMELRWPEEFRGVRGAVLGGQADPLSIVVDAQDEDLRVFASRTARVSAAELRPLLQYTSALVDPEVDADADADAALKHQADTRPVGLNSGHNLVIYALQEAGFVENPKMQGQYVDQRQNKRQFVVEMTAKSARLWERTDGWTLLGSYSLATEVGAATDAILNLTRRN